MHDRLAHAWLRQVGIAAGCAANARVEINGAYYGMFVAEETTSKRVIRQFFPDHPDGDLWKAGDQPETNNEAPDWSRQMAFSTATDIAGVAAIVDLDSSVKEWAAEALLNNADGYYGGNHNFYIYDTGAKGFVFLPNDTDSTFDWLSLIDLTPSDDHPVYWWERRAEPAPAPAAAWLAVDERSGLARAKYVDAIAARWRSGTWRRSRAGSTPGRSRSPRDVAADPHTLGDARPVPGRRWRPRATSSRSGPQFLQSFVDCAKNGTGDDRDGDGVRWCEDCRDDDPPRTRVPRRSAATASTTIATASPTTAAREHISKIAALSRFARERLSRPTRDCRGRPSASSPDEPGACAPRPWPARRPRTRRSRSTPARRSATRRAWRWRPTAGRRS